MSKFHVLCCYREINIPPYQNYGEVMNMFDIVDVILDFQVNITYLIIQRRLYLWNLVSLIFDNLNLTIQNLIILISNVYDNRFQSNLNVIYILCLSWAFFVRLYPINVKTAEPTGPKFSVGPHINLGREGLWCLEFQKIVSKNLIFRKIFETPRKKNCKSANFYFFFIDAENFWMVDIGIKA